MQDVKPEQRITSKKTQLTFLIKKENFIPVHSILIQIYFTDITRPITNVINFAVLLYVISWNLFSKMNGDQFLGPQNISRRGPATPDISIRTTLGIIAVLSFLLNFLFCVIMIRKARMLTKPHNILLLSLAITDLLTG